MFALKSTEQRRISAKWAIALLGETCFDVYLNDVAYWRCVLANVWRCTIGGCQVIKKSLSCNEGAQSQMAAIVRSSLIAARGRSVAADRFRSGFCKRWSLP